MLKGGEKGGVGSWTYNLFFLSGGAYLLVFLDMELYRSKLPTPPPFQQFWPPASQSMIDACMGGLTSGYCSLLFLPPPPCIKDKGVVIQ